MNLNLITNRAVDLLALSLFRGGILYVLWNYVIAIELKLMILSFPLSVAIVALIMLIFHSPDIKLLISLQQQSNVMLSALNQVIAINALKSLGISSLEEAGKKLAEVAEKDIKNS